MWNGNKCLCACSMFFLLGVITVAVIARRPAQPQFTSKASAALPIVDDQPRTKNALFARWAAEYVEHDLLTKTPIPLKFSRAFSANFTNARGTAELDFRGSQVRVAVDGLEEPAAGEHYEVWLVDHVESPNNTAAIELGEQGDRILNLGKLPTSGSLLAAVDEDTLASFRVDMAAVMQIAPGREPEFVIGGMQSIRFQVGRDALLWGRSTSSPAAVGLPRLPITLVAKPVAPDPIKGSELFFTGQFGGNGRTCATCHPLNNDFTIDVEFVSNLLPNDPLFLSETDSANLPAFDADNPLTPAFEDPVLMRSRGLILENINGFAVDRRTGQLRNPPLFRAVPGVFNLNFTAPFGLGGNIPDLQAFSTDAVVQHFPKTLRRSTRGATPDFRLPTSQELKDMEAFMLAPELRSPVDGIEDTFLDALSLLVTTPAEIAGRDKFLNVGCTACHLAPNAANPNRVFSGGNFNTNVELFEKNPLANPNLEITPTIDTGNGNGTFNTPQLFGLRKAHFFHTGVLGNHFDENGAPRQFENIREAITFYLSDEFAINDPGLSATFKTMTSTDLDNIAAFLVAISGAP